MWRKKLVSVLLVIGIFDALAALFLLEILPDLALLFALSGACCYVGGYLNSFDERF